MHSQTLPTTQLLTGEELYALGDIGPCELIAGRIVPVAPTGDTHGACEAQIAYMLRAFLKEHPLGRVRTGEVGIYTRRNPDTVRGADVLFISHERYAQQQSPGFLQVAPELVVEVLSPHDRWSDINQKLREYFTIGVRLVWIVNPASRSVFVYRALTDVREYTATDSLTGEDILPGFSVPVYELFEE